MRFPKTLVIVFILAALLMPYSVQAKAADLSVRSVAGVSCSLPESDAEALVILPKGHRFGTV